MLSYIEMDARKNLALAPVYRLYMDKVDFNTRLYYKSKQFQILFLFSHKVNSRANSYTLKIKIKFISPI